MTYYDSIKAVQYGVGPIGSRIAWLAAKRGVEFVGAIDIDPEKVGRDLGEVIGLTEDLGTEITDDEASALAAEPDVVFHSTLSSLSAIQPQLEAAMEAGTNVISTTESLVYPWWHNPDIAEELDTAASKHNVTCMGTGINPGFAMDTMPAALTAASHDIEHIRVARVQDAATRRKPLQEKIGASVDVETFESEVVTEAGHIGLPESVAMLASALGFDLTNVSEETESVIAEDPVETDYVTVEPGNVAGIHQVAHGMVDEKSVIELDLKMYVGADHPRDEVEIQGEPDLDIVVDGGFHGDIATSGVVVNAVPHVQDADPGLATMIDLTVPSFTP